MADSEDWTEGDVTQLFCRCEYSWRQYVPVPCHKHRTDLWHYSGKTSAAATIRTHALTPPTHTRARARTHTHTRARAHAHTRTHARTRAHAHTHARTHARTHTHTHTHTESDEGMGRAVKNSLEIIIKQVRLEGVFERGGRISIYATAH